jgi:hypothetical protein
MAEQAYDRIARQLAREEEKAAAAAAAAAGVPATTAAPAPKKELSEAVKAGMLAGNINITESASEFVACVKKALQGENCPNRSEYVHSRN